MHTKTDSEVTSLDPSSPRRQVYYVQSPSRDSHDGEKTTTSFQSTPVLSPMGSPPHSHSSVGRDSSSSRFSGSRKISPNDIGGGKQRHKTGQKACDVIEEEGLLEEEGSRKGLPRRCYILFFVVGFFVLFSLFSLILWGASRPQKPKISLKSIKFERFVIQAGTDFTGVATDMISMNSTVKLSFHNPATFFGVHVTATPLDLSYSQLTIASGTMKEFYQSRQTHRPVVVSVEGNKIPLYGSGSGLMGPMDKTMTLPMLKLSFTVRSRAYVLGRLVKTKFYKKIECPIHFDPKKMNVPISLRNSCTYD